LVDPLRSPSWGYPSNPVTATPTSLLSMKAMAQRNLPELILALSRRWYSLIGLP
jgi:hypothetical protein